jgi:collagenase-like PrtC family protease
MVLKTIDGRDFLAINGIQTLSHSYVNLCGEIDDLIAMGVGHLRLMPHSADMIAIAAIFADHIAGRVDVPETRARLDTLPIPAPFSNGFWHGVAGHQLHLG